MISKIMKSGAMSIGIAIAIPIIAILTAMFSLGGTFPFLDNFIKGLPIFDVWASLIGNINTFTQGDFTIEAIGAEIINVYISSFYEATIIGICMSAAEKIYEFLEENKLVDKGEMFFKLLGMIGGMILCLLIDTRSAIIGIAIGLILVIVLLCVLKFLVHIPDIITVKDILIAIINGLVSVILVGYAAVCYFAMYHKIASFSVVSGMFLISVISVFILYSVDGKAGILKPFIEKWFKK